MQSENIKKKEVNMIKLKEDYITNILKEYIKDNKDYIKKEAGEFIINKASINDYDFIRCKYKLERLKLEEELGLINFALKYCYILFKIIEEDIIDAKDLISIKFAFFETKFAIIEYLAMRESGEDLKSKIKRSFNDLKISNDIIKEIENI